MTRRLCPVRLLCAVAVVLLVAGCAGIAPVLMTAGTALRPPDERTKALNLFNEAKRLFTREEYPAAREKFHASLAIVRRLPFDEGIALNLTFLGRTDRAEGKYADALPRFQESLTLHRKLGNQEMVAANLSDVGEVYEAQKKYPLALHQYDQALAILRGIGRDARGTEEAIARVKRAMGRAP